MLSLQVNSDTLADFGAESDEHERVNIPSNRDRDAFPHSLHDLYSSHRDVRFEKAAAERKERLKKLREDEGKDRRLSALDAQLGMGRSVPKRTVPKNENDPLSQNEDLDPLLRSRPNVAALMERRKSKLSPAPKDKMKSWEEKKDPFADAKRRLLEKYMNPDPGFPGDELPVDDAAKLSEKQPGAVAVVEGEEAGQLGAKARIEQAKVRRGLPKTGETAPDQPREVRELDKYERRTEDEMNGGEARDRNFALREMRKKAWKESEGGGEGDANRRRETNAINLSKKRSLNWKKNEPEVAVAANREPSVAVAPSWIKHLSPNPNLGSLDVEAYLGPQRMLQGQGDPMKKFQFNQVASDSTPPDRHLKDVRDPRYTHTHTRTHTHTLYM